MPRTTIIGQARDLSRLTRELSRCCQSKEEQLFKRFGLSCAEGRVLLCVADLGSTSASAVMQRIGISKGRLSPLVDHLVRKQLVTRTATAGDRRTNELDVTKSGRELADKVADYQVEFHERLLRRFDVEERTFLLQLLGRLHLEIEDSRGALST